MKIGIAGLRGLSTLMGFHAIEGVKVTALCDLDAELLDAQAQKYGIPNKYRIFEDMLLSDIDAVVIATPMQCHVPQTILALEAGKHVLSEVTAGVSMEELFWLVESVEKSGKTYMMAENYCYIPDIQLVLGMIKAGLLGEVYYGEGEYLHNLQSILTYQYGLHQSGRTSWRRYWQMGVRGAYYPTHSIGPVMQWFQGERIAQIACFGSGNHIDGSLHQEDTTITMCQMESGKLARIRLDALSPRPHHMAYYTVQGTKGVVEFSRIAGQDSKVWLKDQGETTDEAKWKSLHEYAGHLPERYKNATKAQRESGHGGGDFFIVEDFVNAVRGISPNPIDVYTACEWTAVGILSRLSIMNNSRMIDVPHFRPKMPMNEKITKI